MRESRFVYDSDVLLLTPQSLITSAGCPFSGNLRFDDSIELFGISYEMFMCNRVNETKRKFGK